MRRSCAKTFRDVVAAGIPFEDPEAPAAPELVPREMPAPRDVAAAETVTALLQPGTLTVRFTARPACRSRAHAATPPLTRAARCRAAIS